MLMHYQTVKMTMQGWVLKICSILEIRRSLWERCIQCRGRRRRRRKSLRRKLIHLQRRSRLLPAAAREKALRKWCHRSLQSRYWYSQLKLYHRHHLLWYATLIDTRAQFWICVAFVVLTLLARGPSLTSISDTFWHLKMAQQIWNIHPMLAQCWASVADGGPTLYQHWVDVSCLLGPVVRIWHEELTIYKYNDRRPIT